MRKLSYLALTTLLSAMAVYVCSCATGGGATLDVDPITPAPQLAEGTSDPNNRVITITKEGIIVMAEHWSRARLDRKFTTVDARSPFFYLDTWRQSFQNEVFYVTIKNETDRHVIINIKETKLYDDFKYEYIPLTLDDLRYKLVTKRYMDLKTRAGLEKAEEILLMEVVGPDRTVEPEQTIEGFIPFYTPSSQATKVWLVLTLEKEPAGQTGSYKKLEYRFDFVQDVVLRKSQAAAKR